MKLISMTDFVLEQENKIHSHSDWLKFGGKVISYANFLKQPLTLSMFVPCDENGNVLKSLLII